MLRHCETLNIKMTFSRFGQAAHVETLRNFENQNDIFKIWSRSIFWGLANSSNRILGVHQIGLGSSNRTSAVFHCKMAVSCCHQIGFCGHQIGFEASVIKGSLSSNRILSSNRTRILSSNRTRDHQIGQVQFSLENKAFASPSNRIPRSSNRILGAIK